MSNVKPQPITYGNQLVFPYLWSNGLWARLVGTQGLPDADSKVKPQGEQEKDQSHEYAVVKQLSFSGKHFSYKVYLNNSFNIRAELPIEREAS